MIKLKVNDKDIEIDNGLTVLQACEKAGVEIPRFCYHEKLSIAGNCRMCLVEIEKSPKPVASCAMPATEGMIIKTNTNKVEKARKGVMEFLLANHPLDCPVCDQGGECDLQDQSMFYGIDKSRFKENKRYVPEKYMGPLIKTQMTRCIHCTRCIRFATEIAGVPELGAIGRGEDMQITTYLEKSMQSELSANVIDLCPVGALTSKPYVFEARPWELKKTETVDVMDAVGSNIRVDTYGWEVKRVLPKINDDINEEWISDKTRYACDGLKSQRLDTPFIKKSGNFEETSWDNAIGIIKNKIMNSNPLKIGGFIGDLTNMETQFAIKDFFNKVLKSNYLDTRCDYTYLNLGERKNYIFNSQINGIEESDFILLVGSNPRQEATILNARIRKACLNNKTKVYSFGDQGDLTYKYETIKNTTEELKNLFEKQSNLYKEFKKAKKPLIVFGYSFFLLKSAKYLFDQCKQFLDDHKNNIENEWEPLNIISRDASTVGGYDLQIYGKDYEFNYTLEKLHKNELEIVFLFGQDNLKFKKNNEFIIYIGSHGDKGAEIADIILPSPAYTEQDGFYTNLEGKLQKAFKASYPTGNAKEEWIIINELSKSLDNKYIYQNKDQLIDSMLNFLKLSQNKNLENNNNDEGKFYNELIFFNPIDYYYSNVIARASKTMSECRSLKVDFQKTGTEG